MKRFVAAILVAFVIPGLALAKPPTAVHRSQYQRLYHRVAREFGARTPGRNITDDGLSTGRATTDADVAKSIEVLRRMLAPPPAPVVYATGPVSSEVASYASSSSTSSASTSSGASGVPACASESGTNYSTGSANTNPSSGATGRYQILPSTAAAYGCDMSTPAGQDACAQVIYAKQGSGAWVGCGG